MIVVLDANVLASAIRSSTVPGRVVVSTIANHELVLSLHILESLRRAWSKPYFVKLYDRTVLADACALLESRAKLVTPTDDVHGVGEDEEDDLVLATAVAARADYLVTGDQFLLDIGEFRGIPIVTPREFLEILAASDD